MKNRNIFNPNKFTQKIFESSERLYYFLFSLTLIILILTLSFLVYFDNINESKVSLVNIEGGQNQAEFLPTLRVDFKQKWINSESQKNQIVQKLKLEPKADFNSFWFGNTLILNFNQPLKSSTNYKLSFEDLKKDFNYKFFTKSQKLLFLEKSEMNKENVDKIIETDAKFSFFKEIYSSPKINFFRANKDYLIIGTNDIKSNFASNQLKIINLKTQENFDIKGLTQSFESVRIANKLAEISFLSKNPAINSTFIQKHNLDFNENINLITSLEPNKIKDINYTSKDTYLIFKDFAENVHIRLNNEKAEEELIFLGSYKDITNLNFAETQLVTVSKSNEDLDEFKLKNLQTKEEKSIFKKEKDSILDLSLFNSQDQIILTKSNNPNRSKDLAVEIHNLKNLEQTKVIAKDDNYDFDFPKINLEDRFVVIEKTQKTDIRDTRVTKNRSASNFAKLVIYDLGNQNLTEKNIPGIEAIWLN
jgi:hypothetical protein